MAPARPANLRTPHAQIRYKNFAYMRHSRPLDGIRAIAVLMVMCFHYGYFAAGWVGVQIFFTLSGYLITGILLENRGNSFAVFMGNFYWHRAVRILPLLYVFLLVVAVIYAIFRVPISFRSDWPSLATFTANFARMRPADLGPCFVHIWSLAVEQQFYLVWPALLFFLSSRGFRFAVAGILIFSPLLRLAIFHGLTESGFDELYAGKAVYVLPFTQFDAFAVGAAIPLWDLDRMRNAGRWFLAALAATAAAGLGVLAWAYFGFGSGGAFVASLGYAMFMVQSYEYVWGYSLLNLLSMLGIICALQGIGPFRMLEARILVWVGKISYGVYMYHIPLLRLGESTMERVGLGLHGIIRPVFFVVWVVLVIVVSDFSFRKLETPFLRLKNYWRTGAEPQASRG
jgi:peptidoglycan/LPS O-acetylase OafA/YrhL